MRKARLQTETGREKLGVQLDRLVKWGTLLFGALRWAHEQWH